MASHRHTDAAVLDAARDCVASVGVRRTTVADVARRAGASRMTVYRMFPDVRTLWSTLLTRELSRVFDEAESAAASLPTARARLVAAAAHTVREVSADPVVRKVLEVEPELLLPYVTERLGQSQRLALERVRRLLEEGRGDGSIRDIDAGSAAYLVQLVCSSLIITVRVSEGEGDAGAVIDAATEMLDAFLARGQERAA
ncbi:MAG: TetR/AcrR family transcriptional regulator [Candidatus Dormibacteria bacterium]